MKRKTDSRKQKGILFLTLASTTIVAFMGSALNPSIPAMSREFQLSAGETGWLITAYMLTCTSLPVPFGRIADVVDRKIILVTGIGIFSAASAGGAAAGSLGFLLCMRMLQGAGTAMVYSTSMSILVSGRRSSERGRLLGYSTAATYLGLSSGPVIGGILSSQIGWRFIFTATAATSAVAFFCAWRLFFMQGKRNRPEQGFPPASPKILPSWQNVLLHILWVVLLLTGVSAVPSSWWGWPVLFAGVVLLVWSVFRQRKSSSAVLPVWLFWSRPVFGYSCLFSLFNYGTVFVLNYLLSIYLQLSAGYSAQTAGLVLAISPAVQTLLSPAAGKLSDRKISPGKLAAAGLAGTGTVAAWLGMIQEHTSIWLICIGLAWIGVSCALFAAPNTSMVMEAAGEKQYSMAAAVLSTMRSLGHSFSIAAASAASALVCGSGTIQETSPQQILMVMKYTLFLWSFLCLSGFIVALRRKM